MEFSLPRTCAFIDDRTFLSVKSKCFLSCSSNKARSAPRFSGYYTQTAIMKLPFNLNFNHGANDEPHLQELRQLSLFKTLSIREMRELDDLLHERSYQTGETIFDEGDTGLGLFIVVDGKVKISSSHTALQQLAPELGKGEFFGELSLFDEEARTGRAMAAEPTRVVALFRTEFFSLLERNRSIAAKILFELSRTVCQRSRRLAMSKQHPPIL
jgi:CRP/FNR family cyclic AMP-dependent transcriptional regulator